MVIFKFMLIMLLLLLVAGFVFFRRLTAPIHTIRQEWKEREQEQRDEQERQERVEKNMNPSQSTADMIRSSKYDLDGGEYADFEELD